MTRKIDWRGFGKAVMEGWPEGGIDGFDLQELAEKYNVIRAVEGGFNPKRHNDAYGVCPDPGDPWFLRNYR